MVPCIVPAVILAHSSPVPQISAISSKVSVVTSVESMSKKKALKDASFSSPGVKTESQCASAAFAFAASRTLSSGVTSVKRTTPGPVRTACTVKSSRVSRIKASSKKGARQTKLL